MGLFLFSAFASHLLSPPYNIYYTIYVYVCQTFITLYLVFYSQFYQHLVYNIKKNHPERDRVEKIGEKLL